MKTKLFLLLSVLSLLSILSPSSSIAASTYTPQDVSKHSTPSDCWIIINEKVYNITSYLPQHDSRLNIRPWCGTDATTAFNTKNGQGEGHSNNAFENLSTLFIGDISPNTQTVTTTPKLSLTPSTSPTISKTIPSVTPPAATKPIPTNKYNVYLPTLITVALYFLTLKLLQRNLHNTIWNTISLLGLVPSFGFGLIMALSYQFPILTSLTKLNMRFNHVELSLVFGTAVILHLITRLHIYFSQIKSSIQKPNSTPEQ